MFTIPGIRVHDALEWMFTFGWNLRSRCPGIRTTVHLVPTMVEVVGWRFAFATLAVGPFLGVWAMASLRAHPDSVWIAGGRR